MMLIGSVLLMSSCGTYTGEGAYAGATLGSVLGSAIGGISGGWRGSDIGSVIGMAGGAAVGAAIGAAADQKQAERVEEYHRQRANRSYGDDYDNGPVDESGFDATNSGDDRIDFDGAGPRDGKGGYPAASPRKPGMEPGHHMRSHAELEIRNVRLVDVGHDGILRAGEECKVVFEIMNNTPEMLYDVQPTVSDVTGNKHIHISPNLHIDCIAPNTGIRYTASILAGKKLKDGTLVIRVGVARANREITSQTKELSVQTRRR